MNYYLLLSLLIMALVTYCIRVTPMVLMKKKIENRWINDFLYYIPFCILAAMTFPEIIYSTSTKEELHLISGMVGTITALFLAWRERGLLIVAAWSFITAAGTEWLMRYFGV